jgi:hypothetical protein
MPDPQQDPIEGIFGNTSLVVPVPTLMNLVSHAGYLMGLVEAFSLQSAYMDDEKLESLTTEHDHIMEELINAL